MSCLVGTQRNPMPNPYHNHYYTETDLRSDIMGVWLVTEGRRALPTLHPISIHAPLPFFPSSQDIQ